jgi:hypothetical protein
MLILTLFENVVVKRAKTAQKSGVRGIEGRRIVYQNGGVRIMYVILFSKN